MCSIFGGVGTMVGSSMVLVRVSTVYGGTCISDHSIVCVLVPETDVSGSTASVIDPLKGPCPIFLQWTLRLASCPQIGHLR